MKDKKVILSISIVIIIFLIYSLITDIKEYKSFKDVEVKEEFLYDAIDVESEFLLA